MKTSKTEKKPGLEQPKWWRMNFPLLSSPAHIYLYPILNSLQICITPLIHSLFHVSLTFINSYVGAYLVLICDVRVWQTKAASEKLGS